MANYSVEQALTFNGLSNEAKNYLQALRGTKTPAAQKKVFVANNKNEALQVIERETISYTQRQAHKQAIKDCINIVKGMLIGSNGQRRIISADELKPQLKALRDKILLENKGAKLKKAFEESGLTKTQIIELLSK